MSERIQTLKSWDQMKKQKRTGSVVLTFPDGSKLEVELKSLSKAEFDAILEKYDKMRSEHPAPTQKITVNGQVRYVPDREGKKYEEYQEKMKAIDKLQMAELALAFMVVKPEGTFEEQIKELNETLIGGHFGKIIEAGMKISGFGDAVATEEEIDEIKNS